MLRTVLAIAGAVMILAQIVPAYASGEAEYLGLVTGAALGGAVGNQFGHGAGRVAATAGGVVAGGFAGDRIGASFDSSGLPNASSRPPYARISPFDGSPTPAYTANYVAPPAVDPSAIYATSSGYCRQIPQQILTSGGVRQSYAVACMQPDGTWRIAQ